MIPQRRSIPTLPAGPRSTGLATDTTQLQAPRQCCRRRIATRYDRRSIYFLSPLHLVIPVSWA